jgi:hypothetical protein
MAVATRLARAGLMQIHAELEEAASVAGGAWLTLRRVVLCSGPRWSRASSCYHRLSRVHHPVILPGNDAQRDDVKAFQADAGGRGQMQHHRAAGDPGDLHPAPPRAGARRQVETTSTFPEVALVKHDARKPAIHFSGSCFLVSDLSRKLFGETIHAKDHAFGEHDLSETGNPLFRIMLWRQRT